MIRNKKLSEDQFFKQREEVLAQWPTGKEVNLNEAIEYHKNMPNDKNVVHKLRYAKENNEIYASTGMGKSTVDEQIELLQYVEQEGQADLLAISVDSFTRQNNYEQAQRGMEDSLKTGKSKLNGVPVVNVGVSNIRKMVESVKSPIRVHYGAADGRLCDEILFAGGCSFSFPDPFMDFWQHSAKVSLDQVINTHQYVGRLMGYYEEHGVSMCPGIQGFYGAGMPPSSQTAAIILSSVALVEQGVKNLFIKCIGHGNLVQDVASSLVRCNLLQDYLNKLGYHDIEVFTGLTFNLMQYPVEIGSSFAVTFMNTLMAKLIGAQVNDIRTVAEAKAIPTKEDIVDTFRTAKAMQNFLQTQKIEMNNKEIDLEAQMEVKEVRAILDKVLELGDGDVLVGAANGIKTGVLDNPFAANRAAAGKVLGIKDIEGAIRYYHTGNLPFSKEIVDYHKEKIAEREKKQNKKVNYDTLVSDLLAISKGYLV